MIKIQKNFSLRQLNTFGVEARADYFVRVSSLDDLTKLIKTDVFQNNKRFVLGGGSNVLFTKDFDGLVIKNEINGVEILQENDTSVAVRAYSGEDWNKFVNFSVERNLWGIENLACIPGTVGASPIQNIGAYGVEAKDVIKTVGWFDLETGEINEYKNEECIFGYRDSIFKNKLKNRAFIVYVDFVLSKTPKPKMEYSGIAEQVSKIDAEQPTSKNISDVICQIRANKLPDWHKLGTAGSFFKNPVIVGEQLQKLRLEFPEIPSFDDADGHKIPAGWLIEQCGWKGHREGNVGVYEKHALILVNYGDSSGEEVLELANRIKKSVLEKFGIELVPEVCLV